MPDPSETDDIRPVVTVGLPVYNGADLVAQSVRSVLDQDLGDLGELELVISDNASTDETVAVIRRTVGDDPRVRIIEQPENRGAAQNYNVVLDAARAPLFRWHAHDDLLEPGVLRRCVETLRDQPEAVLAYTWTRFIHDDGSFDRIHEDDLAATAPDPADRLAAVITRLRYCNAVFGVVRTDVLRRTAQIAPFPGSDVSLLYELSLHGPFALIPEPLFTRRPGRSIKANNSIRDLTAWFDPSTKGRRTPGLNLVRATVGAIRRADLPGPAERRTLLAFARHWPGDYARKWRRRRQRRRARAVAT